METKIGKVLFEALHIFNETWYAMIGFLGLAGFVAALLFPIPGIDRLFLGFLGSGLFLIACGEAEARVLTLHPVAGGLGYTQAWKRRTNIGTWILHTSGTIFLGLAIWGGVANYGPVLLQWLTPA